MAQANNIGNKVFVLYVTKTIQTLGPNIVSPDSFKCNA